MVDRGICDQTEGVCADPLPEDDIFVHGVGLQLCFLGQIEDLQSPRLCLERDDLFIPVHDGTVGLDWPLCDLIIVL